MNVIIKAIQKCASLVLGLGGAIAMSLFVVLIALALLVLGVLVSVGLVMIIVLALFISPIAKFFGLSSNDKIKESLDNLAARAKTAGSNVHPFKGKGKSNDE